MKTVIKVFAAGAMAALLGACASQAPLESPDGLTLVPDTKFGLAYVRPGADIKSYTSFGLTDCDVAFRKNWLRDQNQSRIDLSNRVTQEDVDKIRAALSQECGSYFRKALQEAPAYNLVEEFNKGEDVLIIQPSIVNLDVNAPDTMRTGISRTYTTSTGEMTLILELIDATTGEVLARVTDRSRGMDNGTLQWTNSVTNKAEADRILRRWAKYLRDSLDEARSM
tara:strand:- start:45955 stop:46626 length:672 start_codon:yes stop_codon:yes gene_type:complete